MSTVQLPPTVLPLNTVTPFYRARLEVVDGVLRWGAPRTVLGLGRMGTRRVALPLSEVTAVRSGYGVHPARLLVGLGLLVVPLLGVPVWAFPILLAAAALQLVMAPDAQLVVRGSDGRARRLAICIRHRIDVDLVAAALSDLIGSGRSPKPPAVPPG